MILFPELTSTIGDIEIEKASRDLPHKLVLRSQSENSYKNDCGIMLFPHDVEHGFYTLDNDILCSSSSTNFGYLAYQYTNQKATIDLNLDLLKQYYRFVEIFAMHYSQGYMMDFFVAEKTSNVSPKVLFGYTSKLELGTHNIHIGTFARLEEDRWKFYPKMDNTMSRLEIVEKYWDKYQ